ncbi:hypothetical protein K438DRAFT_1959175 [Mycena galopus ATCC 62051]|nr:hypothetical protein K438DRAFT_1959175 [Mycena galopus ATCC 62051]
MESSASPPKLVRALTQCSWIRGSSPDVLLLIFDLLSEELFSLSILCRRFHFLALPIFLEKNAIPDPCGTVKVDFTLVSDVGRAVSAGAVILALTVALFVPSIKYLVCVFPATYTYERIDSMGRVTRLIWRLTRVENLCLEFFPDNHYQRGTFARKEYSEGRLWQKCYSALHDLLAAVEDKSCTSLTIQGAPASIYAKEAPSCPPRHIYSLSSLSLHLSFSPGYSSWIFSALKSSPIASLKLSFTDATEFDPPNFPATHPLLQNLTLAYHPFRGGYLDPISPPLRLNNLVTLTATLSYLFHFFPHTCDPPFPVLEHITILLDNGYDLDWTLVSLIERVRESYSELQPPTVAVEFAAFMVTGDSLLDSIVSVTSIGGKWAHATRNISALTLRCDPTWFSSSDDGASVDPAMAQLLLQWFRLFNGVRDIMIQSHDGEPSTTGPPVDFADQIGEALSSVQTIRFKERILFERL